LCTTALLQDLTTSSCSGKNDESHMHKTNMTFIPLSTE
jgi:hypothetical protein